MSDRKVLLVGNGSNLNRGCEAILRGTERLLRARYGDLPMENHFLCRAADLEVPYMGRPAQPSEALPRPLFIAPGSRRPVNRGLRLAARLTGSGRLVALQARAVEREMAARTARPCLALELGGDNYTFDYGYPYLHEAIDRALVACGCPIVIWGASVGPFERRPRAKRWIVAHLHRHVTLILAREPRTVEYLHNLGLGDRVCLMGDPAFLLEPKAPPADMLPEPIPDGAIGVNLSPLAARFRDGATGRWVDDAGHILQALAREFSGPLVLVPHVTQPDNDDHDLLTRALAVSRLPASAARLLPPTLTSGEIKWAIGRLAMLIGVRTHATIAAFSSRVPTLSLAYSAKEAGLNAMLFGDQRYVLPIAAATPESVVQMARRVWQDSNRVRDRLDAAIPEVEERVRRAVDMLEPLLAGTPRRPVDTTCYALQ